MASTSDMMLLEERSEDGQGDTGDASGAAGSSSGSGSGSGGGAETTAGPSEYRCTYPSCGKSFTRKDHLIRHAANHTETNYYCPTCARAFKRLDLLHRHAKRNICGDDSPSAQFKRRRTSESDDRETFTPSIPPYTPTTATDPRSLLIKSEPTSAVTSSHNVSAINTANSFANHLNTASAPPSAFHESIATMPDFEVSTSQDWGFGLWQPDPWDALLQDTLAPPFNERVMPPDLSWSIPTPRVQESAERNQSMTSAALVARIQVALPELDISLLFLTEALNCYWTNISPTFPFIHRGTFDLDLAPPQLVAMMAVVGSASMSTAPRPDFRRVVQRIRGVLVQDCGLEMPISTLQAFCLCHVHDTWYGTAESQFVAQCMWPVMVAHSRKKGIGVVGRSDTEAQEEEAWTTWANDEERRRAAFCVLLIDTQLSAFWNQHPSRQLSIFAHNIALPCPRNQWDAPTAADWLRLREPSVPSPTANRKPRSGYLPGLHPEFQVSTVSEGYSASVLSALAAEARLPFRVDLEGALGVEMILIGLMAIAWDCRTRGGMGIRFRDGTKHWRSIVLNAVINLRAAWEVAVAHLSPAIELRDMRDTFAISIISVLSDIPMLQVAAGATSICGATIGPKQYKDAQRRLRMWGKTDDAWTCLWQSARYLRQAMFADWGIYTPYTVYLTTLVHWAYSWTLSRDNERVAPPTDQHAHRTTILLDTILASPQRLDVLDAGVGDMIACAAEKLAHGQEIERECGTLLWRLVSANHERRSSIR